MEPHQTALRFLVEGRCPFYRIFSIIALKYSYNLFVTNRGRAAGIVTGYWLHERRGRSSSPGTVKNFHFSISSRPDLEPTQSPIQCVPGGGVFLRGVKRYGREADHSPPTSVEVKRACIYISAPLIRLYGPEFS
jgi:hypothetical protein